MTTGRSIRAGAAFVELQARDGAFVKAMRRSKRMLSDFGDQARRVGQGLVAGGAGIVAPLGVATRMFAKSGDQLDKMSTRTGVGVAALSELKFAAEQSGASIEDLGKGLQRMNRRLGRIAQGSGESTQVEAMRELGLSVADIQRMNPEQRLNAIADGMAAMEDPTQAAGLAQRAFGGQVDKLLPLLFEGSEGMAKLRGEARAFGLTVSRDAATRAADLTDALNVNRRVVTRLAFEIGDSLQPIVLAASESVNDLVTGTTDWIKSNAEVVRIVAKVGAVTIAAGAALIGAALAAKIAALGFGAVAGVIGLVGTMIGLAGTAIAAMLSPIGLVLAAVVGLGAVIFTQTSAGADGISFLADKFGELGKIAKDTFGGIMDALSSGDFALAGKILWTGIKLAWVKGTAELRSVWISFTTWVLQKINDVVTKIQSITASVFSRVAGFAAKNTGAIASVIRAAVPGVGGVLSRLVNSSGGALQGIANIAGAAQPAITAAGNARDKEIAEKGRQAQKDLTDSINDLTDTLESQTRFAEAGGSDFRRAALASALAAGVGTGTARAGAAQALAALGFDADRAREIRENIDTRGEGRSAGNTTRIAASTTALQSLLGGGGVFDTISKATQQTAANTKKIASRAGEGAQFT